MYSLKETWIRKYGEEPVKNWSGKLYCHQIDPAITFSKEKTQGFMTAYAFILVTKGWLKVHFNGKELMLHRNDLHIYSPGLSLAATEYSKDFEGLSLVVDESATVDFSSVHDLVQIVYPLIVQLQVPMVTLSEENAERLERRMHEIIYYLHADHSYRYDILRMLYAIFLVDLQEMENRAIPERGVGQRVEEIFIGFIRLLHKHFIEHHDIAFYARELNISPVYLSRVVRRVSNRTVIELINNRLLTEASFLLRTTNMAIAQIADHLHFADAASFGKFFTRLRGVTPRTYREGDELW